MNKMLKLFCLCIISISLSNVVSSITMAHDNTYQPDQMQHMDHMSSGGMMPTNNQNNNADETVIDAGNKTCPVTGSPVNGKDFVVYKSKRYGVCCPGCDKEFLKDPEKYIKILKGRGEIK